MPLRKKISLFLVFFACVFIYQPSQAKEVIAQVPTVNLKDNDRILILAPHPDDEILGCSGVVWEAISKKLPIKIVFLTYGDNNEWSFLLYNKHPVLMPKAMQNMGLVRQKEAKNVAEVLGVRASDLIFLGYPDFGTMNIWRLHWNQRQAFKSMLTKVRAVPYDTAFRPKALYKGEEILKDLKDIIRSFKPSKIFVSHPGDYNGDHCALYLFTKVALWDLNRVNIFCQLYPYLIHFKDWPWPRGYHPELSLTPPEALVKNIIWQDYPLTSQNIEGKQQAIKDYRTQYISSPGYLFTFVRKNELFGDFCDIDLSNNMHRNTLLLDGAQDYIVKGKTRSKTIAVKKQFISLQNNNIVFTFMLNRLPSRHVGVCLYLFGYRDDVSFSLMPKINIRLGAIFRSVYNQKQRIPVRRTGITISRQGRVLIVRVPIKLLNNPKRILINANMYLGNIPLDWRIWRVVNIV